MEEKAKIKHKTLVCSICGSHDIKIQPISNNLWVVWCESCNRANRVEKTVAFAAKEDLGFK